MDWKADQSIHDSLAGGEDVDLRAQPSQYPLEGLDALFRHKHGFDFMTACASQLFEHHHALGDEAPIAADQVALAHIAKARQPWVAWIADRNGHGHGVFFVMPGADPPETSIKLTLASFCDLDNAKIRRSDHGCRQSFKTHRGSRGDLRDPAGETRPGATRPLPGRHHVADLR